MSDARVRVPNVTQLTQLQIDHVDRWHQAGDNVDATDVADDDFQHLVCQQHAFNYLLWHEEDKARSPTATDQQIAEVKRRIDQLNQQRNDTIEKIDDALAVKLAAGEIKCQDDATINTETPGSAIDRLSIMALRLYHYREQFDRDDVDQTHRETVLRRIDLCQQQHADLSCSLQELLNDLFAGRKIHKTYRQMKMYNDPSLNPAIYNRDA
ncbi:MAG: DUF4254 domain-containing protein [Pirellulaceae bacterium]|nr:DUF4254 domain-containing protein [Pirellulaceae bacterium]